MSAVVSEVHRNSLAEKGGIEPGDLILKINNKIPRDVIDYQIEVEEPELEILIERNGKRKKVRLDKNKGQPVGIRFESSLFDGLKHCWNNCVFCFLDQMPGGLRKNLYVKDDDYRLSFLYGNFITLTNIQESDILRIVEQKLSPLYVSLHSTNHELRKMMFRPRKDKALHCLAALLKSGIQIHIQIVLCPGINDGANLESTVQVLDSDFSEIQSIGLVPVGLTKFRSNLFPLRLFTAEESRNLIQEMTVLQQHFLKKRGTSWIFLADEFYLQAKEPLPPFEHYEDFPQFENGIGITRMFLQDVEQNPNCLHRSLTPKDSFTVITGTLAAHVLEKTFTRIQNKLGGDFNIIGIPNRFFGDSITVAGLITATDILGFLKSQRIAGTLLVPEIMLNPSDMFIDGISFSELATKFRMPVEKVPVNGRLFLKKLSTLRGK